MDGPLAIPALLSMPYTPPRSESELRQVLPEEMLEALVQRTFSDDGVVRIKYGDEVLQISAFLTADTARVTAILTLGPTTVAP